ncbi:MAG: PPOX class F420-dependent oxidoreductase [Blastocatellia bacterium]
MNTAQLAQFSGRQYLNLESFRRNGESVRTPLWFAQEGHVFYVYTLADSWKVRRMRNNPRVRLAPCTMRGRVEGQWIDAEARLLTGAECERAQNLLRGKYGWMKRVGEIISRFKKRDYAVYAIAPV